MEQEEEDEASIRSMAHVQCQEHLLDVEQPETRNGIEIFVLKCNSQFV